MPKTNKRTAEVQPKHFGFFYMYKKGRTQKKHRKAHVT